MPIFLIFLVMPILEIMVFFQVWDEIGFFNTLFLCLLTAVVGIALVKHQGLQTLMAMRRLSDAGIPPEQEVFDSFCLVGAGFLLIIPGFLSDALGFLLLVPAFRVWLRKYSQIRSQFHANARAEDIFTRRNYDPDTIEGEFERVDERSDNPRPQIKPPTERDSQP